MGPQSARAAREDEHGAAVHHVAPHHRPGGKRVLEVAVPRGMHHDRRRPQGHRSLLLASAVAPASAGPCPLPAGAPTRARYRERTNGPNGDTGRMSDPRSCWLLPAPPSNAPDGGKGPLGIGVSIPLSVEAWTMRSSHAGDSQEV